MSRHDVVIIKDTHRGLLYEDGVFRDVLPAGRYHVPRATASAWHSFFGARRPKVDLVLVDVRGRDRTVVVQDFLTADGATISATFAIQYRVVDPKAAIHQVKNFEERAYAEAQAAARRTLRGMSLEEVMGGRDEIGEELFRQVRESASAYGVEVSGLDFKDLIVPEDLRKLMNRAVLAKRLRQAQAAGSFPSDDLDDEFAYSHAGEPRGGDDEDGELIDARLAFRRDREGPATADLRLDGLTIRRPDGHGPGHRNHSQGVDPTLRRYRP